MLSRDASFLCRNVFIQVKDITNTSAIVTESRDASVTEQ